MVSPSVKRGVLVIVILVLAQSAFAQLTNWAQTSAGFCANSSQCLVSASFSPFLDNIPLSYFDGLSDPSKGPKCIANGQFILDHYCDNGVWASRSKLLALRLLALNVNNDPFVLQCGSPEKVLPRDQLTDSGYAFDLFRSCSFSSFDNHPFNAPCANNVCVLKYGNSVALGLSLNSQIDSSQSVLRAFNKSISSCNSAVDNNGAFDSCGSNFWYDHKTESLIYAPVSSIPSPVQKDVLEQPFSKLKSYVFTNVHSAQRNFSFYNTPDFSDFFVSGNGARFVFGFKQSNVTLLQTDYLGIYLANVNLPQDSCSRLFKRFDDRVHCEIQSANEFFVVASRQFGARQGIFDAGGVVT